MAIRCLLIFLSLYVIPPLMLSHSEPPVLYLFQRALDFHVYWTVVATDPHLLINWVLYGLSNDHLHYVLYVHVHIHDSPIKIFTERL